MDAETNVKFSCSFCGKNQDEVKKMVAGGAGRFTAFICNECCHLCEDITRDPAPGERPYIAIQSISSRASFVFERYINKHPEDKAVIKILKEMNEILEKGEEKVYLKITEVSGGTIVAWIPENTDNYPDFPKQ